MPTLQEDVSPAGAGDSANSADSQFKSTAPLSFGQQLVGISFNPAGDPKVNRAKELCAELADLLHDHVKGGFKETTALEQLLYPAAVHQILLAQMDVVKVLTLKY